MGLFCFGCWFGLCVVVLVGYFLFLFGCWLFSFGLGV